MEANQKLGSLYRVLRTGTSALIEVLASEGWEEAWRPSPRYIQEPLVVTDRYGRPQEDPLAVPCFCVCRRSALLGDLLGVTRSMERPVIQVNQG